MATSAQINSLTSLYVGYFDRAPDPAGLQAWINAIDAGVDIKTIAGNFATSAEATALYPYLETPGLVTPTAFVESIYLNLFNRTADTAGRDYWVEALNNGSISPEEMILEIIGGAQGSDQTILDNKIEAGLYFAQTAASTPGYAYEFEDAKDAIDGVTEDAATVATAKATTDTEVSGGANVGETFTLTTGIDNLSGTENDDTFTGLIAADDATVNALDEIDGGDGADSLTLNVTKAYAGELEDATFTSIETFNVRSSASLDSDGAATNDLDVSGISDLTTLNVTKADDVAAIAATTTDVNVSGVSGAINVDGGQNVSVADDSADQDITIGADTVNDGNITVTDTAQGNGAIAVDGGTDVTIAATSEDTGTIAVGATTAASGAVAVTQNLESDGDAALTGGAIDVVGGSSVDITVNANSVADDEDSDDDITVGAISATSDGNTTSVNVVQNDNVTTVTEAEVEDTVATQTLVFEALDAGETTTVGGLTFEASEDLTAEEVAEAFAGLTEEDTQDAGGPVANGIYSGGLNAGWTSAAAAGATVVFTADDVNPGALGVGGDVAAASTYEAGTAGSAEDESGNSVNFGSVTIDEDGTEAASITTVTLDGFDDADIGTNESLEALTSASLTNSAGAVVIDNGATAATLDLTVNEITGTVDIDNAAASVETLNLTANGEESDFDLTAAAVTDLDVAANADLTLDGSTLGALEAVSVSGAGAVDFGDISGETALNSFDASGNTGGVTATVATKDATLTGDLEEYVFSEGDDVVTLDETDVDVDIALGGGDDKISLASGTTALTGVIAAGAGTDTLAMDAADADTASGNAVFETKISGFEKLEVGEVAATDPASAIDVDMANMDDINYVITNGLSTATDPGTFETSTVTFEGLLSGQSVTLAKLKLTAADDMTATEVAEVFDDLANGATGIANTSGILTGWASGSNTGADVTFTAATAGDVTDLETRYSDKDATVTTISVSTTDGVAAVDETTTMAFSPLVGGEAVVVGDGTDTITVTAKNAAVESVTYDFEDDIISGDVGAGEKVTLAGITLEVKTVNEAADIEEDLAQAFVAATNGSLGDFTGAGTNEIKIVDGSLSADGLEYNWTHDGAGVVTATATTTGNKTDLSNGVFDDGTDDDVTITASVTDGVDGSLTAEEVAELVADATDGTVASPNEDATVVFSDDQLDGWTATQNSNNVTFTKSGDATDLTLSGSGAITSSSDGTDPVDESAEVTFKDLKSGQSVTIGGITATATDDVTADDLEDAFNNLADGDAANAVTGLSFTGKLSGWSTDNNDGDDGVVVFTSATAATDVKDIDSEGGYDSGTAAGDPTDATFATTDGGVGATASGSLTLSNFVDAGTVELSGNKATDDVTVEMADATGDADSLNIVIDEDGDTNVGTVTANDVETINIAANDTFVDADEDGEDDTDATHTLVVDADSAESIVVTGDDLNLDTNSTVLTSVNASAMTGGITYTADGATAGTTVLGGEGADNLTASGSGDVLNGGAGDDTLTGDDKTEMTGGAGADTFVMNTPTNVNSYSTITDLSSGDIIDFDTENDGTVQFSSDAIELNANAVFQDYANAAVNSLGTDNDDAAWFQFAGNTYIVQSGDDTQDNDFQNGTDSIIEIVGTVDLSTASYNETNSTLEIA